MYLQNKYTRIYFSIIDRAKTRNLKAYKEKHHVIPRSLGGTNDINNIVELTAREHFVCHLLLTRMVTGKDKSKMYQAAWMMATTSSKNQERQLITNRTYETLRIAMSNVKKTMSTWNKGVSPSDATRLKLRAASLQKLVRDGKLTQEEADRRKALPLLGIGESAPTPKKDAKPRKSVNGWKWSEDARQRLSTQRMGRTPWNKGQRKATI